MMLFILLWINLKSLFDKCGGEFREHAVLEPGFHTKAICLYRAPEIPSNETHTLLVKTDKTDHLLVFYVNNNKIYGVNPTKMSKGESFTYDKKQFFMFEYIRLERQKAIRPYQLVTEICGQTLWEKKGEIVFQNEGDRCGPFAVVVAETKGDEVKININRIQIQDRKVGYLAIMKVGKERSQVVWISDKQTMNMDKERYDHLVIIVYFSSQYDVVSLTFERS